MERTEYFRKYRGRKQEWIEEQFKIMNEKLDRLMEAKGQTMKLGVSTPIAKAPVVKAEKLIDSGPPATVIKPETVAAAINPPCLMCGVPATHIYDGRFFCVAHHGRGATPL